MPKTKKRIYSDPNALSIYVGAKVNVRVATERHYGIGNTLGTVEYIHKSGLWCTVRYQLPDQRETLTTTLSLRPVTKRDTKGDLVTRFYPRAMQ